MKNKFSGIITALVTPFKEGKIDFLSLGRLMRHQLENGINGFVVAGSTGEAATLTLDEKSKLLDFVKGEVGGQVPVIMGSGTFNTQETCRLAQTFKKSQPDALLVVTPYYNRPPQRGLVEHFLKVGQATDLPIIIYNVPTRTAVNILPETVAEIAEKSPSFIGIKEAGGQLGVIESLKEMCPKNFVILSGDDGTFLGAMDRGGAGVISVLSHVVPKWCVEAGRKASAHNQVGELTQEIKDLVDQLFCESNPIPVKWALKEMGLLESSDLRLPLVGLDFQFHEPLKRALKKAGALR